MLTNESNGCLDVDRGAYQFTQRVFVEQEALFNTMCILLIYLISCVTVRYIGQRGELAIPADGVLFPLGLTSVILPVLISFVLVPFSVVLDFLCFLI